MSKVLSIVKRKYPSFLSRAPTPRNASRFVESKALFTEAEEGKVEFAVGFEGVPWTSDHVWAMAVLKTILGNAESFSSGGPGKGMYSRAHQNLLNAVPEVESAAAISTYFADAGLFGLHLTGPADAYVRLIWHTIRELCLLEQVSGEQLSRAKNILKRSVEENMEQQGPLLEQAAKNSFHFGVKFREYTRRIEAVTAGEVQMLAKRMLAGRKAKVCLAPKELHSEIEQLM